MPLDSDPIAARIADSTDPNAIPLDSEASREANARGTDPNAIPAMF
jgi:hypothetical protein